MDLESMLDFPGGRGSGGIRCLVKYVGKVCGNSGDVLENESML